MYRYILSLLTTSILAGGLPASGLAAQGPQRVVSLGGSVTEIIYELGQGHLLAGTDLSSTFPPQATSLPRVGYYRSLPLEGLLSLQPDMILASEQAGPRTVLDRVQQLGIAVETVSDDGTLDALYARIKQVATALQIPEQGDALADRIHMQMDTALSTTRDNDAQIKPVRVVMLLKRTAHMQAAGSGTTAGTLLDLAGLRNVLDTQRGYAPLSVEALAALQPELIITTTSSIDALGGTDAFLASAGVSLTPAAQRNNLLIMDDMLILGLGPRTPRAIQSLTDARAHAITKRTP